MLPSLTDIGGFAATRGCTPCAAYAAIPAHPQKQYTRRWRLYHFCGFYYPIREVIPIAIYHCNISIVSRGKGKSAVAAAAYRSGEKLTNEWDGMTHDYTRKGGVVHTEILLPPNAPPSFSDRSTLWNSVELYEKAGNAQLAREIDAALPIELSREEQIRLVREYCSSQFVSRGMCVDFAIHDTDSGNPHCHIMLLYYTQEQIDRANQADLVSFLQSQGEQLTRAGNEYRWKRHDSLTVRGNKWYRHSQSKGGGPVDFVMEFFGKSFTEAVELLTGEKGAAPPPDRPCPASLSSLKCRA